MLFPGGDKTRTLKKRRGHDRQRAKLILRQVRSRLASQLHLSIVRSPTPNSMPTNRPPRLGSPRLAVSSNTARILLQFLFAEFSFRSSRITTIRFEEPPTVRTFFSSPSFPLIRALSAISPRTDHPFYPPSMLQYHPRTRREKNVNFQLTTVNNCISSLIAL